MFWFYFKLSITQFLLLVICFLSLLFVLSLLCILFYFISTFFIIHLFFFILFSLNLQPFSSELCLNLPLKLLKQRAFHMFIISLFHTDHSALSFTSCHLWPRYRRKWNVSCILLASLCFERRPLKVFKRDEDKKWHGRTW